MISRAKRFIQKKKRSGTNSSGGKTKFIQGIYIPINEGKYSLPQNDYMNKGPYPEYRSSWELKLMKWCDMSAKVQYWTCEPFAIQYVSPKDGKPHRYFPDFLIKFTDGTKWLVEIKPKSQHNDLINLAKWEMAEKFCSQHGLIWKVMSKEELGIK